MKDTILIGVWPDGLTFLDEERRLSGTVAVGTANTRIDTLYAVASLLANDSPLMVRMVRMSYEEVERILGRSVWEDVDGKWNGSLDDPYGRM